MKGLKKGDLVILKTEWIQAAPECKGKILECVSDEFKFKPNFEGGAVLLKGVCGALSTDALEKINAEQNVNSVPGLRQFVNGAIYDHERLVLSYEQAEKLMQSIETVETTFYSALHDTMEENKVLANELAKMIADMKKIYELSARNGISEKLDDCFYIARKYVEGVFS